MLIWTARLSKKRAVLVVIALGLVMAALICLLARRQAPEPAATPQLPAVMPASGSPLLGAAHFNDILLGNWFEKVNYIGAFSANDNWLNGWTEFDPENADY